MAETQAVGVNARFRFGVFEVDPSAGELRRSGLRVKLHQQPMQILLLLIASPGQVLTREELARELWPDGTFVDYEQGVNSAVNRLRAALGDDARNPRFIETLSRRGYRFVAPVERIGFPDPPSDAARRPDELVPAGAGHVTGSDPVSASAEGPSQTAWLPSAAHLPLLRRSTTLTLFVLFQAMYLAFYVGALANLWEIQDLLSPLPGAAAVFGWIMLSAALLIPVRVFEISAALLRPPAALRTLLRLWPFVLAADLLWSLAPFLLLHHMNAGLALACTALLVYAPFAQRSLLLMGAVNPLPQT